MTMVGSLNSNLNTAFKAWFGNSVVKQNGKPIPVYHGSNYHAYTKGQIEVFNTSSRGGAFFSSSKDLAGEYGERVYPVYIRIENPLIVHGDGQHWTGLGTKTRVSGKVTNQLRDYHHGQAKDIDDLMRELSQSGLDDSGNGDIPPFRSKIKDDDLEIDRFGLGIIPGMDGEIATDHVVKQARQMGYDGVIFREINDSPTYDKSLYRNVASDVFAVFSPYQIKSVNNNGEWSRDDPNIYV